MTNGHVILTISDVANLIKMTEKSMRGLAKSGYVPGIEIGSQWQFLASGNRLSYTGQRPNVPSHSPQAIVKDQPAPTGRIE